ncbi:MAG: dihydropteroate synthase [Rickettsiales bacterium]|nr:dihydropteroate synthase [Rickettsiales bacterium]
MVKVAIGLGSNLGDRDANLQRATVLMQRFIRDIVVSSYYEAPALLADGAPKEWDIPFINAALTGKTELTSQALLQKLQQIEQELGREKLGLWSPRSIDLDILLYGDEVLESESLTVPHAQMLERGFVMRPLKEIASDWVHPVMGKPLSQILKTKIIGIVNVTPDSFSDAGTVFDPQAAITHARQLLAEGADILDIGAESTRPNAEAISPTQEWQRLELVLTTLKGEATISVDTRHAETAAKAFALGVEMINDVSAASNEALIEEVAKQPAASYVLMHSLSVPADPSRVVADDLDVVAEVLTFAQQKIAWLQTKGVAKNRIIFDVGIGFGKTAQQSLELINRIAEFKVLGVPLYVGHSRKSFMTLFTDVPARERDELTLKYSKQLATSGVEYLRVHNVGIHHGI